MLDINFIRENKDLIDDAARKKHISFNVGAFLSLDDKRRKLLSEVEERRSEQNSYNQKIAQASIVEKAALIQDMQALKEPLSKLEEELKEIMKEWQKLMLSVPNIPDMSVPEGEDDTSNKEIRAWGKKPRFSFKPKDHKILMEGLNILDTKKGAELAGFRGYFLKGDGALLNVALWRFVMDSILPKGFQFMIAPSLLRREAFMGTGYLPQGEDDLYKTQDGDYLAGTGEVGAMGYFMDKVFDKSELPIKILAFSPCFRREAGSYGRDVQGIFRVHEFFKLEQIVLCEADHNITVSFHEEITKNAEEILQKLSIPYRVVINCGGDLGLGQVKKYDIESWIPSQETYRETHSSSYFHDFQTRRLNIKYRDSDGRLKFVHSLNNTAIATPRIAIPLIENFQREDGSISIPEALRVYMQGKENLKKS
ncbi:MAG: serine--tRNA ligase [Candidatus Pacebacteria bacterium]|nr:serine--tRNA ligase [Candidatus Paceibacterota bacterium]